MIDSKDKKVYKAKHSSEDVQRMRKMAEEGYAINYIARKFKCCPNAAYHRVYDVIPARVATPVQQKRYLKRSNLEIADVKRIRQLALQGMNAVEIGKIYGISQTTALSIVNGKTFRWVPGKTLKGIIHPVNYEPKIKTDRRRGPKNGSKRSVKSGVLIKYAEKHGVGTSTICRRIKKGKIKIKKDDFNKEI